MPSKWGCEGETVPNGSKDRVLGWYFNLAFKKMFNYLINDVTFSEFQVPTRPGNILTLPSGLELGKWVNPCCDLTGVSSILTNRRRRQASMVSDWQCPECPYMFNVDVKTGDWSDHWLLQLLPRSTWIPATTLGTALGHWVDWQCPGYLSLLCYSVTEYRELGLHLPSE